MAYGDEAWIRPGDGMNGIFLPGDDLNGHDFSGGNVYGRVHAVNYLETIIISLSLAHITHSIVACTLPNNHNFIHAEEDDIPKTLNQ